MSAELTRQLVPRFPLVTYIYAHVSAGCNMQPLACRRRNQEERRNQGFQGVQEAAR